MKYQCESCKKVFTHPAKQTINDFKQPLIVENCEDVHVFGPPTPVSFIELSICPFCHGLAFSEYVEPQPEITSIQSVDINQADALIAKGYVVLEAFAKTVTLVKQKGETETAITDEDSAQFRKDLKDLHSSFDEKKEEKK